MKKIPNPYIDDIKKSIEIIERYTSVANVDKDKFFSDIEKQDAVIRRLEIIVEAAKRLETSFKNEYANIPWKKMSGLRDVLIHDYDEVDLEMIWRVIVSDIPELKKALELI